VFVFVLVLSIALVAAVLVGGVCVVGVATHSLWAFVASAIIAALLALPTWWLVMYLLSPIWKYQRCPTCRKRKLVMCWSVRSNPPSPAFYRCVGCGARFSRFHGDWMDASDPRFDGKYTNDLVR
jgi:DNA-directed RNA polymerase subunit RPC12/RpoP